MASARVLLLVGSLAACAHGFGVGDSLPSATLDYGFPPSKVDLNARVAGKNVVIVGLPGAFTPT